MRQRKLKPVRQPGAVICRGDLLLLDPLQLPPEVPADGLFLLIGGPECQPFSRAGKGQNLYDLQARTLLWIVWCLAVRQFDGAFVENVANLLYVKGGRVVGITLALLEGLGYQAVPAVDSPISHGIPRDRKRVFISILRSDHADKWGLHVATAPRPPHCCFLSGGCTWPRGNS
jgi:site-specific DNA-cytosine methylase